MRCKMGLSLMAAVVDGQIQRTTDKQGNLKVF